VSFRWRSHSTATHPGGGHRRLSSWLHGRRNTLHGRQPLGPLQRLPVEKGLRIPKWGSTFAIGARFFNLLNHPSFAFPNGNIDSPGFGQITSLVSQPTTILGSGLGADASPRLVELTAKITF
jgi:hypothetical protein